MKLDVKLRTPFSLEKAIELEPFLFFYKDGEMNRILRYGSSVINVQFSQKREKSIQLNIDLIYGKNEHLKKLLKRIEFCLGINEDLNSFLEMVKKSYFFREYLDIIRHIRIFSAFDEFEACACIILSQNTSYASYRRNVQRLLDLNNGIFPSPQELLSLIDSVPLGYRKKYLVELIKFFEKRNVFRIFNPEDINVKGFGKYSKDIYFLFQHRDFGNIYLDRLTEKIFKKHLGICNEEAKNYLRKEFSGYEGLVVYITQLLHRFKML